MSQPRTAGEVHAEQVANAEQAVAQAERANVQQQSEAGAWMDTGLPAGNAGTPIPVIAEPATKSLSVTPLLSVTSAGSAQVT